MLQGRFFYFCKIATDFCKIATFEISRLNLTTVSLCENLKKFFYNNYIFVFFYNRKDE